jgi:predicted Zn-dependent protease
MALGLKAFQQVLKEERISRDPVKNAMVRRVGHRIAKVVRRPDFQWEFVVIDNDDVANAFCLPGGKVVVYSGLFRYVRNEASLATVLAHEVAHVVARHGAERMTHALLARVGQAGLNLAIQNRSPEAIKALNAAYGIGVNVGALLPFSRQEELEADQIGLIYMAKAGYDPTEAVHFWRRMARAKRGKTPPELLSTHPAHQRRIRQIQEHLPQALLYYRKGRNP